MKAETAPQARRPAQATNNHAAESVTMDENQFLSQIDGAISSASLAELEKLAATLNKHGFKPTTVLKASIRCRSAGYFGVAERMMKTLIDGGTCGDAAYFELAVIHRLQGEPRKAASTLERAMALPLQEFRTKIFLAHMLAASGAHPEAVAVIDSIRAQNQSERLELFAVLEFNEFLSRYPLGRALHLLDSLIRAKGWASTAEVEARLMQAIRDRSAFALVRLGDGEGGCMALGPVDECDYQSLYRMNRKELIEKWFGAGFDWEGNGFLSLAQGLTDLLLESDLVGLPYESWVRHEYAISSLRGVPSLVNVFRYFAAHPAQPSGLGFCSQHVHIDLHLGGALERVIRSAGAVSVISCLQEIPALVTERFGITDVEFHRIPGEKGSSRVLGEAAVAGSHYPEVFNQLNAQLSKPHNGRLFLIAGGLLGKIYAATVRRHGGIALDVGSLVDAWTGHATRPGYGSERLRIPG